MGSVYFRIFAKLFLFIFGIFFIIFFIVYGYRYDKNVGFIQKNVYVEFKFWGENQTLKFNGSDYNIHEKTLKFYNIEDNCYDIDFHGTSYKKCLGENDSYFDVFIQFVGKKDLGKKLNVDFERVDYLYFSQYGVEKRFFSTPIQNAFKYNEINFVQTDNKLFYCTDTYSICKYITDTNGEVIGGNKNGIILFDKDLGYNSIMLK